MSPARERMGESVANQDLVVAFDIAEAGYKSWDFPAFGLIFVAVGLALLLGPKLINRFVPRLWELFDTDGRKIAKKVWYPRLVLAFALAWIAFAFTATYKEYRSFLADYRAGNYSVVEGVVEDFIPMPKSGHRYESFTVGGASFHYSDFNITAGFNNTRSHGGPMDEGIYVRVYHAGNTILRLEVEPSALVKKPESPGTNTADQELRESEIQSPVFETMSTVMNFWIYGFQLALVCGAVSGNLSRNKAPHSATPELYQGPRYTLRLGIWAAMPVTVALITYCVVNGLILAGDHTLSMTVLISLNLGLAVYLSYWVFFQNGAQKVANSPYFSNHVWVVKAHTLGLLGFLLLMFWGRI